MRILYTLLFIHLLPIMVLRLFIRARKAPAYAKRIGERFALIPHRKDKAPLIWVHAVSVGEVIAAVPMVQALKAQYPDYQLCITTTTPTGSERVKAAFADSVLHYYLPYDLPSLQMVFIRAIRPSLLIIMETELWPNLLAVCEFKKIPTVLANGRMSARSAKGYQRFSALTQPMVKSLSVIAAQGPQDAERFIALGAKAKQVHVTGSIKFDIAISDAVMARRDQLAQQLSLTGRRVCVFASTHPGEDERLLPMIKCLTEKHPSVLAIVVPRHPERFAAVKSLADKQALRWISVSDKQQVTAATQLVVGDTMGDMLAIYGLAEVAFIGGSLIPHGGHNMLEAALWGIPIISGESVFNFQAVVEMLQSANAITLVANEMALQQMLEAAITSHPLQATGQAAKRVLLENQGALNRLIALITTVLPQAK